MRQGLVGMLGEKPVVKVEAGNPEAEKYGRMWERPEYRICSPGEQLAATFLAQAQPPPGAHVLDFGCGTGRGALMLAILGRCRVTMIDFVRNCLDPEIHQALTTQADMLAFRKLDLERPIPLTARYGYCVDVMEHIPTDKVDRVLANVTAAAQHVFFSIALGDDTCGQLIDETLHLTVQPPAWWLARFAALGIAIHWSEVQPAGRLLIYGSAWETGRDVAERMSLNIEAAKMRANVEHNVQHGWTPALPHGANDLECMILGGGPSLNDALPEIRRRRAEGVKLITLNGAYNWALSRDLVPSLQVVADARALNARFTKPVVDDCRYMIGSQCDPSVFEGLPKDRTFIWHMNQPLIEDLLVKHYPEGWYCIPGGSTVLLRTMPLLRMLGYKKYHLYGCDYCVTDRAEHHAYIQPENDGGPIIPVILEAPNTSGRVFLCAPWMISQATEFIEMIRKMGDLWELQIHGDGLLRYILETGAMMTMRVPSDLEPATTED